MRVVITGAGAFLRHSGSDVERPVKRGQAISVSDEVARRLVEHRVARYEDDIVADDAEVERTLKDLTVAELRELASERRVNLQGATVKGDIIVRIEEAEDEDDDEDDLLDPDADPGTDED